MQDLLNQAPQQTVPTSPEGMPTNNSYPNPSQQAQLPPPPGIPNQTYPNQLTPPSIPASIPPSMGRVQRWEQTPASQQTQPLYNPQGSPQTQQPYPQNYSNTSAPSTHTAQWAAQALQGYPQIQTQGNPYQFQTQPLNSPQSLAQVSPSQVQQLQQLEMLRAQEQQLLNLERQTQAGREILPFPQSPQTFYPQQTNPAAFGNNFSQPQYNPNLLQNQSVNANANNALYPINGLGMAQGQGSVAPGSIQLSDLVNVNLPKVSSPGYASAVELVQHYGLPIESVAEITNESHALLEDKTARLINIGNQMASEHEALTNYAVNQEKALIEYAKHFIDHQQFLEQLTPHIERYENMEALLLDPQALGQYYRDLVALEQEMNAAPLNASPQYQPQGYNRQGMTPAQAQAMQQAQGAIAPNAVSPVQLAQLQAEREFLAGEYPRRPELPPAVPNGSNPQPPSFEDFSPAERFLILDRLEREGKLGQKRTANPWMMR